MTVQSPRLTCYLSTERPTFSPAACDAVIGQGERRPDQEDLVQSREPGRRCSPVHWVLGRSPFR